MRRHPLTWVYVVRLAAVCFLAAAAGLTLVFESTALAIALSIPLALAMTFAIYKLFGWLASLAPEPAVEPLRSAQPRRTAPAEPMPRIDDDPFRSPPAPVIAPIPPPARLAAPAPARVVHGDPANAPKLLR